MEIYLIVWIIRWYDNNSLSNTVKLKCYQSRVQAASVGMMRAKLDIHECMNRGANEWVDGKFKIIPIFSLKLMEIRILKKKYLGKKLKRTLF